MYKFFLKSLFDKAISLLLIVVLFPLLIIVIIILILINRGSPFFIQKRTGYQEKDIFIIKFKTMRDLNDSKGFLLPDNQRLTIIGKILRITSIDELPQLFNVLFGSLSLIGPRPLLNSYLPLYSKDQLRRHDVKPGITGLAQINGRNQISWNEKFNFDLYYVDNLSFALDVVIFFKTIIKIIKMDGINQTKSRPMEPFNGKN